MSPEARKGYIANDKCPPPIGLPFEKQTQKGLQEEKKHIPKDGKKKSN